MKTVYISHPILQCGIDILQKEAKILVGNTADLDSIQADLKEADALLVRIGEVRTQLLEQLPKLRVIMRPGVGTDNIDVDTCTRLGIPVAICPGTNLRSVAEHAVAIAYAITKNIVESIDETNRGNYTTIRSKYAAVELEHKKLGVVGFGNIGRETAKLFAGNGMNIYVFDPFVSRQTVESMGYHHIKELKELLNICDLVTLHMPSTPQTKGMFGPSEFAACKQGLFLINCARGDIIQEDALYEALVSGRLGGAATDVMCTEPFDTALPLFQLPNFIATPHMAALTKEAAQRTFTMAADNILALLHGEELTCVVNPEVYQTRAWKDHQARR